MYKKYDVIVIGTGIAGLFCANILAKAHRDVLLLSKYKKKDCNTYWAQGGIATALNMKDVGSHIQDTINAGAGLCDKDTVELLVNKSLEVVPELIKLNVPFDRDDSGNIYYTKEAAHSKKRIIHAGGDATGKVIHESLMKITKSDIMPQTTVIDLLIENDICYGVFVEQDGEQKAIYANNVVIASGGVGSLFAINTNAKGISGDIHGICVEHGLRLRDMNLLQFHPTVFVGNSGERKLLLTEALRGEGAKIIDEDGNDFLLEYDKRGSLAPRDIVARSIFLYKQKTKKEVYLDLSMFSQTWFKGRFPTVYQSLREVGVNVPEERVKISPALHYTMGGIKTEHNAKVGGCKNLYAIGEAASNRVHGANRLASNSLLEGLVFGKISAETILKENFITKKYSNSYKKMVLIQDGDDIITAKLAQLMWESAGVVRSNSKLKIALEKVTEWLENKNGRFLELKLLTAKVILKTAIKHTTSIGAHYLIDEKGV